MTVNISWSLTNGGTALSTTVDHGSSPNGDTTTAQSIFVRHNGANTITSAVLYIQQFTGAYSGSATQAGDISEILSWGDVSTLAGFGGVQFNLNATGTFPAAAWSTYDDKAPTGGNVCRTGVGDSAGNGITLPTSTGASAAGTIQTGSTPNVRFQMRVEVPSAEDTVGVRQFDLALSYSFTS